jgi:hypothetical protein
MKDTSVEFNSDPIPASWRKAYETRPIEKLPGDMLKACDALRAQGREINSLRSQVLRYKVKNFVLVGLVGGAAAEGVKTLVILLFKHWAH